MPFPRSAGDVGVGACGSGAHFVSGKDYSFGTTKSSGTAGLAQLGPDDLGRQDRLVEVELAVQLLHDGRLGVEVDDGVDAFGLLVDLERQPAAAPHVDLLHGAAASTDDVEERVERGSD